LAFYFHISKGHLPFKQLLFQVTPTNHIPETYIFISSQHKSQNTRKTH